MTTITDTTPAAEQQPEVPQPLAVDAAAVLGPIAHNLMEVINGLNQVGGMLIDLINSRMMCHRCWGDRMQAAARGVAEDDLPGVSVATLIVGGNGVCPNHMPSGLIVPGR